MGDFLIKKKDFESVYDNTASISVIKIKYSGKKELRKNFSFELFSINQKNGF